MPAAGEPRRSERWDALVHPGQKLQPGSEMVFRGSRHVLHGEILDRHFHGRRTIRLWSDSGASVEDAIDAIGHMPLPPYIKRDDTTSDRDRYQTVYARERGSVAAPTAGLHFTPELLDVSAQAGGRAHCDYAARRIRNVSACPRRSGGSAHDRCGTLLDQRGGGRRDQPRQTRETPHDRGRHDDDARAGGGGPGGTRRPSRRSRVGATCSFIRASGSASSMR